jgi:hypothetical protein
VSDRRTPEARAALDELGAAIEKCLNIIDGGATPDASLESWVVVASSVSLDPETLADDGHVHMLFNYGAPRFHRDGLLWRGLNWFVAEIDTQVDP